MAFPIVPVAIGAGVVYVFRDKIKDFLGIKPAGYSAQLGGVPQGAPYMIDANMPDFNKAEFHNAYTTVNDKTTLLDIANVYQSLGYPIAAQLLRDKASRL
jgi:hypothetical protein